MSQSIFLLFSHKLTKKQIADLESVGIEKIVYLPKELQILWSNVPPDSVVISKYLQPVVEWLSNLAKKDDWVLIQGDFGAVFYMVDFCFNNDLIPVYSTTKRMAIEKIEDGRLVKISEFEHIIFRRYERWKR